MSFFLCTFAANLSQSNEKDTIYRIDGTDVHRLQS